MEPGEIRDFTCHDARATSSPSLSGMTLVLKNSPKGDASNSDYRHRHRNTALNAVFAKLEAEQRASRVEINASTVPQPLTGFNIYDRFTDPSLAKIPSEAKQKKSLFVNEANMPNGKTGNGTFLPRMGSKYENIAPRLPLSRTPLSRTPLPSFKRVAAAAESPKPRSPFTGCILEKSATVSPFPQPASSFELTSIIPQETNLNKLNGISITKDRIHPSALVGVTHGSQPSRGPPQDDWQRPGLFCSGCKVQLSLCSCQANQRNMSTTRKMDLHGYYQTDLPIVVPSTMMTNVPPIYDSQRRNYHIFQPGVNNLTECVVLGKRKSELGASENLRRHGPVNGPGLGWRNNNVSDVDMDPGEPEGWAYTSALVVPGHQNVAGFTLRHFGDKSAALDTKPTKVPLPRHPLIWSQVFILSAHVYSL